MEKFPKVEHERTEPEGKTDEKRKQVPLYPCKISIKVKLADSLLFSSL